MIVKKIIKLEVSEEELRLIRSALCDKAMKELHNAFEVQKECQEKGIEDTTSWIYYQTRETIHRIIDSIDNANKAE